MKSSGFKHAYSLLMLLTTVGWGVFSVWMTYKAMVDRQVIDILAASGANVLLGALIKMLGDINQFWFRKKSPPEEK